MKTYKKIIAAMVLSAFVLTAGNTVQAANMSNEEIRSLAHARAEEIRAKGEAKVEEMKARREVKVEGTKAKNEAKIKQDREKADEAIELAGIKADATYEKNHIKYDKDTEISKLKHETEMDKMRIDRDKKNLKRQQKEEKDSLKNQWKQEDSLKDEAAAEAKRYLIVSKDKMFTYYMDTENSRWIRCPYKSSEYIIDAWVKLVENSDPKDQEEEDSKDIKKNNELTKYYLEHYYLRPDYRQIQFISELEVSNGRPNNDIHERRYSPSKWENLVPGSIEDSIYHGVVRNVKKYNMLDGKPGANPSLLDRFHIITSSIAEAAGVYI